MELPIGNGQQRALPHFPTYTFSIFFGPTHLISWTSIRWKSVPKNRRSVSMIVGVLSCGFLIVKSGLSSPSTLFCLIRNYGLGRMYDVISYSSRSQLYMICRQHRYHFDITSIGKTLRHRTLHKVTVQWSGSRCLCCLLAHNYFRESTATIQLALFCRKGGYILFLMINNSN